MTNSPNVGKPAPIYASPKDTSNKPASKSACHLNATTAFTRPTLANLWSWGQLTQTRVGSANAGWSSSSPNPNDSISSTLIKLNLHITLFNHLLAHLLLREVVLCLGGGQDSGRTAFLLNEELVGGGEGLEGQKRFQFLVALLALALEVVAPDLVHWLDQLQLGLIALLLLRAVSACVDWLDVAEPNMARCLNCREPALWILLKQLPQQIDCFVNESATLAAYLCPNSLVEGQLIELNTLAH